MSLREVRAELAEVVAAAAGVTTLDHVPLTPATPSAYIGLPVIDFGAMTAGGLVTFDIPVTFVVGLGDVAAAQHALDAHMSRTVPEAIADHAAASWITARPIRTNKPTLTDDDRLTVDLILSVRAQL